MESTLETQDRTDIGNLTSDLKIRIGNCLRMTHQAYFKHQF